MNRITGLITRNEEMSQTHLTKKGIKVATLMALALTCAAPSIADDVSPGGYDFSYTNRGDRAIWPIQVFDNGFESYFQFNPEKTMPAIFAIAPCGSKVLLTPQQKGPYLVVPGMYSKFSLQIGQKKATVDYSGEKMIPLEENVANEPNCTATASLQRTSLRGSVASPKSMHTAVAPIAGDPAFEHQVNMVQTKRTSGSLTLQTSAADPVHATASAPVHASQPITKAQVEQIKASAPAPVRVETFSVASNTVSASPSPATDIASPPAEPAGQRWQVRVEDVRLATTFERWAKQAGYRIQWDADKHVLVEATPTFYGSFEDAITQALSTPGIRNSSYPLEACAYDNTPVLVRITRQGEQVHACPN
jgi:hypothetical protein